MTTSAASGDHVAHVFPLALRAQQATQRHDLAVSGRLAVCEFPVFFGVEFRKATQKRHHRPDFVVAVL